MNQKNALKLLEESDHRLTRTRQLILEVMLKLKSPFSANDIVAALTKVNKKKASVDAVTVYRNLPVFEDVGIICRSDFGDDMARFMLSSPGHEHHHHHIICRQCHTVEAVATCILEGQEKILKKMGFSEVTHRLEFAGVCKACR